jgi:hypothetical protein
MKFTVTVCFLCGAFVGLLLGAPGIVAPLAAQQPVVDTTIVHPLATDTTAMQPLIPGTPIEIVQRSGSHAASYVLTHEVIQNSGLTRLGDIFRLLDNWMSSTIDGFDWKAGANGLSPLQGQSWTLLLDGLAVDVDVFGTNNLNLLPVTLDQIDSVVVVSFPQVHAGEFADRGLIHIHTHQPPAGISFRGSLMGGNKTGDPGPYRYTSFSSPNLDGIGPDASYTLGVNYGKWYAQGNFATQIHFFHDPAMLERNTEILQLPSRYAGLDDHVSMGSRTVQSFPGRFGFDDVFPGMRKYATSLKAGARTETGRFDAFAGYSSADRYFLFFQPLGREIPVDYSYMHSGVSGSLSLSPGLNVLGRFKYSSNKLAEYPNSLGADFSWERRVLAMNVESSFIRGAMSTTAGGLFRKVALDTRFELDDDSYNVGSFYGSVRYVMSERLRQEYSASVVFSDGETAFKASHANHWRVDARNVLSARFAYSERLFEEDNSLWYWAARGYDILDSLSVDYTINGDIGKSSLFASSVEWRRDIFDEFSGALALSHRIFGDVYLEKQDFELSAEDCSFYSPVVVETGNNGDVFGLHLSADIVGPGYLKHHVFYNYLAAVAGDELFKDAWETIPAHRFGYRFTLFPSEGFHVWGMLSYLSSTSWVDYSSIDGTVCESTQTTNTYYAKMESSTVLDLQIQKWFWHKRVRGGFICRNVWNDELRYHPIGTSFDLTFFFQLKLFFSSGG